MVLDSWKKAGSYLKDVDLIPRCIQRRVARRELYNLARHKFPTIPATGNIRQATWTLSTENEVTQSVPHLVKRWTICNIARVFDCYLVKEWWNAAVLYQLSAEISEIPWLKKTSTHFLHWLGPTEALTLWLEVSFYHAESLQQLVAGVTWPKCPEKGNAYQTLGIRGMEGSLRSSMSQLSLPRWWETTALPTVSSLQWSWQ